MARATDQAGACAQWDTLQTLLATLDVDLTPISYEQCGVTGLCQAQPGAHIAVRSRTVLDGGGEPTDEKPCDPVRLRMAKLME